MKAHRLSPTEETVIVGSCKALDPNCIIYLYGSRADLSTKGGDIDLLVVSETLEFRDKLDLVSTLKEKLGDQRIDLSLLNREKLNTDLFFKQLTKIELKA